METSLLLEWTQLQRSARIIAISFPEVEFGRGMFPEPVRLS
jgi:hypothetical protein